MIMDNSNVLSVGNVTYKKVKVCSYIAWYPLLSPRPRIVQGTHLLPGLGTVADLFNRTPSRQSGSGCNLLTSNIQMNSGQRLCVDSPN